ncbi:Hpt domain-containing protein [Massilia sp. PWRC2]|uniref:Hpt domain-containing protein n=1 Tax=Massilia sp. PWRC2 TaxID=2804626 RepID=UPI003CF6FB1C
MTQPKQGALLETAGDGAAVAPPVDEAFFERLRAMSDKFAAGVPGSIVRLQALAVQFDAAQPAAALAEELRRVLHTIAGSAATFGYRTFGTQARVLEQRLRVLQAFEQVGAAEWRSWLHSLEHYLQWARVDARADNFPTENGQENI